MPDYTDVPATGETITGETTSATKADSDDEIMEVDEEKVVEKDKIENAPEIPKIMIDGENVSEINKDSDSGKIAENNDKTMSENLEVEEKDPGVTKHKKGEEHEEKKNGINSEELVKDSNKDVKSENSVVENKDAIEKMGTTESEDVVMVEDDVDILEAFKTASSLIADLSPCKVDSTLTDKKDTSNVAEQATPDIHSKVNLIDKLAEGSTQLDKTVEAEAKSSEIEVQPSQSSVPPTQDKIGNTSVGTFGSPLVQEVQKDLCLIKSSSFGFTPSSVSDVATLAIGSSCVSSGSTLSSPLVVTSHHNLDNVSSQRISSALGSTLSSPLVTTSPHTSDHVSSQIISSAPGSTLSSPLVTTPHTSDYVSSQRISSAPGSTLSSPLITTPHTSDYVSSQRLSSAFGSTLSSPLVTTSPHTSDYVSSQRLSSAFGSTLSSPLVATPHTSDYVSSQRTPSPNVGSILASPSGIPSSHAPDYVSSQRTTSPAVRPGLSSPLATSSSHALDLASVQRTVAQDHGYTAPPLGTLPVPNLQISVNQPHTGMGNAKLSPILSSYLASPPGSRLLNNASSQNSSPNVPFSVKSPLMRQNSGGFGAYSMATGNNQTGYEGQNLLNIPVTQSLQKSMDTGSQPCSSMFIADFDDQSPGGRKGQKRKRISMATEEIMMYGKRRSARVS